MKNLLLFLLLFVSVFPQQFHSLDGIESPSGQTILLYRLGSNFFPYNPVYKYNTQSSDESLLMQAYSNNYPGGEMSKAVWDFEFFPNDGDCFMNVGYEINPDNHGYIARNDSIVFGNMGECRQVDISKQNPQKVFVFGNGGLIRSWDGGYTFPIDSIPGLTIFIPIALSDFDDNVMFGFNEDNKFSRNTVVVDTSLVGFDQYFKMLYDINQSHIYRVNKTYGGYSLNVSNNKGAAYTWAKTYQSENPIFVAIDSTQSGVVFLADGRSIYKSINNGFTFTHYKSLPSKLVGIYKKPNSEILYAASKRMIFKVTPDSISILKSLPTPDDEYGWFPLAIGNRWVYDSYSIEIGMYGTLSSIFIGTLYMEVTKDTLIENKKYFVLKDDYISAAVFPPKMFLRIDSLSGFIYRYWPELSGEYIFHNLNAEVGDTIFNPQYPDMPFYILDEERPINYLEIDTYERRYWEYLPCSCYHTLVKGFGLERTYFNEYGGGENVLKGCVINGVLYGDTTLTEVNEKVNTIPIEFKLEQNYPNPFNPSTTISWQSPVGSHQTIKLYDVLGKEIETLVDEFQEAGTHSTLYIVKSALPSGIYFYQIKAGDFIQTKKMILLK